MKLVGFYIKSNNIEEMVKFYTDILGAEAVGNDGHFNINLRDNGGSFIIWDDGNAVAAQNGNIVLWFFVDNVDAEYEKLLKMNVLIIESPVNNSFGGRHMVFCDPDGNHVRFVTRL